MSVIGFDIGNESCVIAAAKRGGIDVLLNDESKRETPSVVSFGEKQRFLGSAGAASATANPKSTISQVKRLIGRVYKDPSVQEDLKLLPFATSEGPRGGILIELEYLKEKMKFTPVEILGMLFTHLKQIAEKNLESDVVDCVIGIPSYFTDLQRREYLDAALIAGLNPLRLMHDCTATALGYGMYKTDFLEGRPTFVTFVDIGHCDTQVTVAGFVEGQMKIFSHSFDQNLGGRDFDEVLFKYFAAQFKEKHNIDVYFHARASIRLRASCEKVKKVLSANAEAPLSIDCLIGDQDVRGIITRAEFEKLSSKLLERVTVPCLKAIKDSGLSIDAISTIELVGSGSRIPAIMKILTSLFHREPTRTLNGSECVARGCALRCAMLSPTQKVRVYKFEDSFPYSIVLPVNEPEDKSYREFEIFSKGSVFPCRKVITQSGNNSLDLEVVYSNKTDVPSGISPIVGHFFIQSSETPASEEADVNITLKLNYHGIVEIESASLVDDRPHTRMNFFSRPERVVVDNLVFSENLDGATTKDELREAQKRELTLAAQDKKVEQTKDQRNTLEAFVYDTRSKLSSAYRSFATDSEKGVITNWLQETEDWLYEDSDDECEEDYTRKIEYLKKLLDPIEMKYNSDKEKKARAEVTKAMQKCIEKYRSGANSMPSSHKRVELLKECNKAEKWLNNPPQKPIHQIKEVIELFEGNCKDIIEYKPLFHNHDKPMHPDQRDVPIVSNKRDQPVDADLRDQPVKLDQREQPMKSRQKDQPVDSIQSDQPVDSNESDQHMDQIDRPVDSNQGDCPVEKARADVIKAMQICIGKYRSGANSMSSSHKRAQLLKECNKAENWLNCLPQQPIDHLKEIIELFEWNFKNIIESKPAFPNHDQPMHPDQRARPFVSNQRDRPVDSNLRDQPVKLDQRDQPKESDQWEQLVKSRQRDQPLETSQIDQLVDSNESNQHVDQRYRPVDSNQRDHSVDSSPRSKPDDSNPSSKPVDSNPRSKSTDSFRRNKHADPNQGNKPVDPNQRNKPGVPNQWIKPVGPNQTEQAVALDQRNKPVDSIQRNKHMVLNQRNKSPVGSNQMKQAVDLDQPDDMEVD